jgi:hypothetical protein
VDEVAAVDAAVGEVVNLKIMNVAIGSATVIVVAGLMIIWGVALVAMSAHLTAPSVTVVIEAMAHLHCRRAINLAHPMEDLAHLTEVLADLHTADPPTPLQMGTRHPLISHIPRHRMPNSRRQPR